jgi:hypothetical protein
LAQEQILRLEVQGQQLIGVHEIERFVHLKKKADLLPQRAARFVKWSQIACSRVRLREKQFTLVRNAEAVDRDEVCMAKSGAELCHVNATPIGI